MKNADAKLQAPQYAIRLANRTSLKKKKNCHFFLDHLVIPINKGFNLISVSHYNTHSHGVTSFLFFLFFFFVLCV